MLVFDTGVAMKLMDEVAGIVAARHCNTNIVTASVDAINFHRKIRKGKDRLVNAHLDLYHSSITVVVVKRPALFESSKFSNYTGLIEWVEILIPLL